ncbi:hypothetical protein FAI40_00885 [Acetobacteraceae bacterium]|nr:hypothetical protein FAI40_00885 [Acetobacteraceae bacterium]
MGRMRKNKIRKAALIGEDFVGMQAQLFGLVERLGWEGRFYPVYRNFSRLTMQALRLMPFWLVKIFFKKRLPVLDKETDIVLSIGGFGGWIGLMLADKYDLPIIQIQNPRRNFKKYALILSGDHDEISGQNILSLPMALHGITGAVLKQEFLNWQNKLNQERKTPFLGVLLGGNNGRHIFDRECAERLSQEIRAFLTKKSAYAIIVASRRTPEFILRILEEHLQNLPVTFWKGEGENPYKGVLACCDVLCVTEDSVSMLSEAAATKAALGIFSLKGHSKKLEKFHKFLFSTGRAQAFTSDMKLGEFQPLDSGDKAVAEIQKRFLL